MNFKNEEADATWGNRFNAPSNNYLFVINYNISKLSIGSSKERQENNKYSMHNQAVY
jgi:hypothetical protein